MIDADKHHVLDTPEIFIERGMDFVYFKRVVDVDSPFLLGSQLGSRGLHQSTQIVTILWGNEIFVFFGVYCDVPKKCRCGAQ